MSAPRTKDVCLTLAGRGVGLQYDDSGLAERLRRVSGRVLGAGPWLVVPLLMAAIFLGDLRTPRGVPECALYILVVLIALWPRRATGVIATAAVSTVLIICGFLLSPPGDTSLGLLNRIGSIVMVWAVAMVGLQLLESEDRLRGSLHRERTLNAELDHRVRNNLAALASLIEQTAAVHRGAPDLADRLRARIESMLATHGVLSRAHWGAVGLNSLLGALIPMDESSRIARHGPDLPIDARHVQSLGLIFAELLSNSRRHGALSTPRGRVRIDWAERESSDHGRQHIELRWSESDGPPITERPRDGVGMSMMRGLVAYEMRGRASLTYPPGGAVHIFELALERPTADAAAARSE